MARTGSGKTACFLIPMFERLKAPSQAGARALILSPTRELALQTLKFTKEVRGTTTGGRVGTSGGAREFGFNDPLDVFLSHPAAGQVHRPEDRPDPGRRQVSRPHVPTGPRFPKASPKPGEGLRCPVPPQPLSPLAGWRTSSPPCTRTLTCEWGCREGTWGGRWPPRATRRPGTVLAFTATAPDGRVLVVPLEHRPVLPVGDKGVSIGSSLGRIWDPHPGWFGGAVSPPPPPTWSHQQLCPRRIIATPGRLVHVAVEMKLKLHTVEYVVFDEADRSAGCRAGGGPQGWQRPRVWGERRWGARCPEGVAGLGPEGPKRCCHVPYPFSRRLFEMGFAEQLQEIIARLPDCHQTVLFSATLPKLLVEFARAGEKHGADGSWGGRAGPGGNPGTGTWHGPAAGLSPGLVKPGWAERVSPSREVGLVPVAHPTSRMSPCPTGLTEPMLIRLDVESKLSEQLKVRGAGSGG